MRCYPNDRYDMISTITHCKYDNIREWCTTKYKLINTRGGASYGYQKIKFLEELAWCATNLNLRYKHNVLADFDATMMANCIDEANLDYEDGKKNPDIKKPEKFSHSKWVA